ncbi:reverse transcriptase [Phytophthora megakarya]|uniref:Reverse transcriptase n=1 Tax=Phytophthora megakarya TaxID=4795 RepID=A0A225V9L6_9STRA|nr:reverse transcriptase [Phytophthora megakarya]
MTHLECVSSIPEKLMKLIVILDPDDPTRETPPDEPTSVQPGSESAPLPTPVRIMTAVIRSHARGDPSQTDPMGPLEYQAERWRRIKAHQDEDHRLLNLKKFLRGEVDSFSRAQIRRLSKEADLFVLDSRDVLFCLIHSAQGRPRDQTDILRLAVPETLRQDILYYAHEDFQGGHQGITRTHEKLRTDFYWYGMYADVETFVKECVDCASGKGHPLTRGPPPGTLSRLAHLRLSRWILSLICRRYVLRLCHVQADELGHCTRVAEAYEERVFQRFGASSMIRHDQDSSFMGEVFRCFSELLGSKQRATLGYRPQANGQQERSVQTVIRSVRAYVTEADQSDWDDHAERLMFALNTSFDATRLDAPFYLVLVHGWDAQATVLAILGPKPSGVGERTAYEWRRKLQRDYSYVQACAENLQRKAKRDRAITQTRKWRALSDRIKAGFLVGDAVWLYIPKVQPGLSRKLAHLWHGPFRIAEVTDDFRPRALFPKRPTVRTEIHDEDLAAALLPEDGWEVDNTNNEYEVEEILDLRWSKWTRTSKRIREYLVKWRG